jgi:hypothetical protein
MKMAVREVVGGLPSGVLGEAMSETASDASRGRSEDGPDDLGEVLQRRRGEIFERIEQLRAREQQLADRLTRNPTSSESLAEATVNAAEAEAHALDGHAHAAQAHDRASRRYREAAELHERAADVLDQHGRPEGAQAHREAAEQDRDAAGDQEQAAEADWRLADAPDQN